MQRGNLHADLPDASRAEVIETLCTPAAGRMRIERIVTEGQPTPEGEWYDQAWDEWVAVLSGSAELEFAGPSSRETLAPGDWLLIPAGRVHRVAKAATGTLWLAVHAGSADAPLPQQPAE